MQGKSPASGWLITSWRESVVVVLRCNGAASRGGSCNVGLVVASACALALPGASSHLNGTAAGVCAALGDISVRN